MPIDSDSLLIHPLVSFRINKDVSVFLLCVHAHLLRSISLSQTHNHKRGEVGRTTRSTRQLEIGQVAFSTKVVGMRDLDFSLVASNCAFQ